MWTGDGKVDFFKKKLTLPNYGNLCKSPSTPRVFADGKQCADLCQMKILPEELLLPSPTVTSFIPNLPLGHPFRVSLHSWEPPVATRATTAMAVNQNREVHFEARVLLDGICVA